MHNVQLVKKKKKLAHQRWFYFLIGFSSLGNIPIRGVVNDIQAKRYRQPTTYFIVTITVMCMVAVSGCWLAHTHTFYELYGVLDNRTKMCIFTHRKINRISEIEKLDNNFFCALSLFENYFRFLIIKKKKIRSEKSIIVTREI